jgi:hypothetical protein
MFSESLRVKERNKPNSFEGIALCLGFQTTKDVRQKLAWKKVKMLIGVEGFGCFVFQIAPIGLHQSYGFGYKDSIPNPPTEAPRWRKVCETTNLSHRNSWFTNRGKRKHLPWHRLSRRQRKLPKCPHCLAIKLRGGLTAYFYCCYFHRPLSLLEFAIDLSGFSAHKSRSTKVDRLQRLSPIFDV